MSKSVIYSNVTQERGVMCEWKDGRQGIMKSCKKARANTAPRIADRSQLIETENMRPSGPGQAVGVQIVSLATTQHPPSYLWVLRVEMVSPCAIFKIPFSHLFTYLLGTSGLALIIPHGATLYPGHRRYSRCICRKLGTPRDSVWGSQTHSSHSTGALLGVFSYWRVCISIA